MLLEIGKFKFPNCEENVHITITQHVKKVL